MSYCRWGPDSDVYVYVTERVVKEETEHYWVCCMCKLHQEGNIYAPNLASLRQHLEHHREQGDKVPDYAFERIDREIAEGIE